MSRGLCQAWVFCNVNLSGHALTGHLTPQHAVLVSVAQEKSPARTLPFNSFASLSITDLIFFSALVQLKAIREIFSRYLAAIQCVTIQG